MVQVYFKPVHRRYYASRCSAAFVFFVLAAGTVLVLPFFMAYSAKGPEFWLKRRSFFEQPDVKYNHKLIMVLEGTQRDGEAPTALFFSSASSVNAAFQQFVRLPVLRSREVDDDLDGLADELELSLQMPVRHDEAIYSATLLVFFEFKLRRWAKLSMDSMAFCQASSPLAGQSLFVDGDLEFRQRWPLSAKGGYQTPYSDDELLDANTFLPWKNGGAGAQLADVASLLSRYRARNFTTELNTRHTLWSGAAPATGLADGSASSFNLTATIRLPEQSVLYTPGVSEVLFDAWIRYLALLVVVVFFVDLLASFVFHHQLVDAHVHDESAPAGNGRARFKLH